MQVTNFQYPKVQMKDLTVVPVPFWHALQCSISKTYILDIPWHLALREKQKEREKVSHEERQRETAHAERRV